jgi:hypothetical protein
MLCRGNLFTYILGTYILGEGMYSGNVRDLIAMVIYSGAPCAGVMQLSLTALTRPRLEEISTLEAIIFAGFTAIAYRCS